MYSRNYTEQVLEDIRKLTPNHPDFKYKREDKTYTQKQWRFNLNASQAKETLRKKSTRLSNKEEHIVTTFDDFDRALNLESKTVYTKKWKRLGKRFKINRLMDYYNKSMEEILKILDKIKDKNVEYDEKEGKILNIISDNNIFKDAE